MTEMAGKGVTGEDKHYAIFLRGVNVGGITVRMAELRDELTRLPVHDVATVLASGNVTCSSRLGAAELKNLVEDALRRRFGYEAWVIVVDHAGLAAIAASMPGQPAAAATAGSDPGPGVDPGTASSAPADMHSYVTLFTGTAELEAFVDEARGLGERPAVLEGGTAIAWFSPKGRSTDVPLAKLLGRTRYASTSTTRNINTVEKVLRLLP
ncbi:DUF1697 domain-containing protein [Arthrobacter sp. B1805]|uniref:DUF1697 domain-containing protein n=1 Tax=Arthrobacter sp. B1805 TaxID=2058892 RepID=UPI000CE37625|nr:DUF1697 domain-containing protein [Arthrobacter sp. B1805]